MYMKRLLKQSGGLSRNENSAKYFIKTCSPEWVKIKEEIKKVRDARDIDIQKSQILLGSMDADNAVIIKIGDSLDMDNEYAAAEKVKRFKGFIKFYCFFACDDDFREFFKGKRNTICKGPGTTMKVIFMPHFPLGSIASYTWTPDNADTLHSCLYTACLCYIDAYKEKGFIHNDFHAANILLKETRQRIISFSGGITVMLGGVRPWIGDYEKSTITKQTPMDYEHFKYDIGKLFILLPNFIQNADRSMIFNMATFFQGVDDICSDDARRQLWDKIRENVRLHPAPPQKMI